MLSRIRSAAIIGIDVVPVFVETDISDGLPQFTMVGYVSGQVREAGDRAAIAFHLFDEAFGACRRLTDKAVRQL